MSGQPLIVLRFRDIEINLGETIRQHRLIINALGHTWWGWLFRDYETNPAMDLQALRRALPPRFEIALYDTGQGRLYVADCEDIATSVRPQRSPSLDHTPLYYRNRSAPAWFKLSGIQAVDHNFVIGRTCLALPSASDECHVDLQGRPVARLRDLRKQEVTMWVLGPQA